MAHAATINPPELTERPAHVPEALVRDVDMYNVIKGDEDAQEAWYNAVKDAPDLFWTPRHGGYWIARRADLIEEIQRQSAGRTREVMNALATCERAATRTSAKRLALKDLSGQRLVFEWQPGRGLPGAR